jgi:hypothetical protein
MYDKINLSIVSRFQCDLEIAEEIVPSSPPLDPRAHREVKPKMGVGEEEYAKGIRPCH